MPIDMPEFCSKCLGFDHSPVVADDDPVLEDQAKKLRNVLCRAMHKAARQAYVDGHPGSLGIEYNAFADVIMRSIAAGEIKKALVTARARRKAAITALRAAAARHGYIDDELAALETERLTVPRASWP